MALKLRDLEVSADGTGRRGDRGRTGERDWRGPFLVGLSLLLAIVGAGIVLFFAGGLGEEQDADGTVARPAVEESPLTVSVPGFDVEALRGRLEEIAEGHEGVYGIAMLEPVSGTKVSLGDEEEFMAASIGKLPVFAALYRAAALGELDLEEQISLRSEDIQAYGAGELQSFPVGYSLSLRECAYRMINHSDNTAWAMLDRRLGTDKIRATLEDMGITNSRYSDHLSGYFTTPADVLLLLEKITDPQFISDELSAEMLDTMTETNLEDRIPEKLPRDVRIAHKTGSYDDNFGDAGVVFYQDSQGVEQRYYLVVLAKGTGEYEIRDAIQSVSLAVYEALTGTRVDPGWSREESASGESGADNMQGSGPDLTEYTGEPVRQSGLDNPSASWANPVKNAGKNGENVEPAKLLDEKVPGSRYNVVPDTTSSPTQRLPRTATQARGRPRTPGRSRPTSRKTIPSGRRRSFGRPERIEQVAEPRS